MVSVGLGVSIRVRFLPSFGIGLEPTLGLFLGLCLVPRLGLGLGFYHC